VRLKADTEAQALGQYLTEPALAARVELEKYRAELQDNAEPAADSWSGAVTRKGTLSYGRALEEYARQQARHGAASETMEMVEALDPEKVRPFGFVGIALGVLDRNR
jgi:hypothetical protein